MSLDTALQRLWYGPAWRSLPLWPLALLFRAVVGTRRFLYRSGLLRRHAVGVPVVVVGNVTVGGTGKTPIAAWLARALAARGDRVGVVLRGYGGKSSAQPRIVRLSDNPADVGDEALLHARRGVHVVVIGADRVAAAELARAQGADLIVCDDGLQHLRLARDFEIAVVDAVRGLGNRWMLPAGPLREPAARLDAVDAVVTTRRDVEATRSTNTAPDVPGATTTVQTRHDTATTTAAVAQWQPLRCPAQFALGAAVNVVTGERRALESFRACASLHAVAGVGHPEAFFTALRAHGLEFSAHTLADHAALDPTSLPFPGDATVLMTEKDAVKCAGFGQRAWWWVELDVSIDRTAADRLLASILERTGTTGAGVPLG